MCSLQPCPAPRLHIIRKISLRALFLCERRGSNPSSRISTGQRDNQLRNSPQASKCLPQRKSNFKRAKICFKRKMPCCDFNCQPQWCNKDRAPKILSTYFHLFYMLQNVVTRLQMSETVFKNQLSVDETAFFQCETPILVYIVNCVVLHIAEHAWSRKKTEGLLRFPEPMLPVFQNLTVTLPPLSCFCHNSMSYCK